MKGTFISSDYVIDANNDAKLLEINTDTIVYDSFTSSMDFSGLHGVINDNSITEFHIVYKEGLHEDLTKQISESIAANCSGVTTYGETEVDRDSIYPTIPTDSSDKFILRLAYNENAILDSTYAKEEYNLYSLFHANSNSSSVPEFYYSSSDNGVVDSLTGTFNSETYLPDYIVRDGGSAGQDTFKMVKINATESSSVDIKSNLINEYKSEDVVIQKFEIHSSSVAAGKATGIREYGLIYGSNLDYIAFVSGGYDSNFNFPSTSFVESDGSWNSEIPKKHFYEFTNKPIKRFLSDGLLGEEEVKLEDGSWERIDSVATGSILKSFHWHGLPDTDNIDLVDAWSQEGKYIPTASYHSTASVTYKHTLTPKNTEGARYKTSGSSDWIYLGGRARLLSYESSSNTTRFIPLDEFNMSDHYIQNIPSGSIGPNTSDLIPITDKEFVIFDDTPTFWELDVEPDDAFFLKNGASDTKIVSAFIHNIFFNKTSLI